MEFKNEIDKEFYNSFVDCVEALREVRAKNEVPTLNEDEINARGGIKIGKAVEGIDFSDCEDYRDFSDFETDEDVEL